MCQAFLVAINEQPMTTASRVAEYFLVLQDEDAGDLISNLKLQKLLYYAQGLCIGTMGRRLFNEKIFAWTHGPVVPFIYHKYKVFGANAIPMPEDFDQSTIANGTKGFLKEVYRVFGQFSAWKLRNMTHNEPPYQKFQKTQGEITVQAMKAYFSQFKTGEKQ
jgi:uncharacterized phage-associated protein